MALKNYTLGRGEIHLSRLDSEQKPEIWRYVGNSTELNLTIESESLDHTDPDEGIDEVDDSVQLSVTRSGTLVLDDIQDENLALFLFGTVEDRKQAAVSSSVNVNLSAAVIADLVARITEDQWYPVGVSESNPIGVRNIDSDNFSIAGLTKDTDYELDAKRGLFRLKDTAASRGLTGVTRVTYQAFADTTKQIVSGVKPVTVALKFYANNPSGVNRDVSLPVVDLSPNGDLSIKSAEWASIPFSLAIQAPQAKGVKAVYMNDVPA